MKQLITRVDDRIVEGLKARARAEGRSVNSLVNQLLADAVRGSDLRRDLSARLRAAGLAVDVKPRWSRRRGARSSR